jgi:hypothetical protein
VNAPLPAYVQKPKPFLGGAHALLGLFGRLQVSGLIARSTTTGITASTTHSIAGGTALTASVNVVSTCANAGDALTLGMANIGESMDIYNAGAAAAGVYPPSSSIAIDGGTAGAPVTLGAGHRATFTLTAANTIVSALLGGTSN